MGTILRVLGTLLLLGPLAAAQDVQSTLYTRVDGDTIRAAIEVQIQFGWHIYHTEKGHPDAAATPTTVELSGTGITWENEVVFPEPHMDFQGITNAAGEELWAWTHEGTIVLYAQGTLAEGADGADAAATVAGLVCMQSCLPFENQTTTRGPGSDAHFASFPDFGGDAEGDEPAAEVAEPVPAADVIESGKADATLYTRVEGNRIRAALEVKIGFGYHLYHSELGHPEAIGKPTSVELKGEGITWGAVAWPAPEELDQGIPGDDGENIWIWSHDGTIVLHAEGTLAPGATGEGAWGVIKGQTCDDMTCVNYKETFVSAGPGLDELFPAATATDTEAENELRDVGLWMFLLFCVGGGLFALMMPCTYPMIPITISFFTKQADARKGNVLPLSLAYGGGIVLIFVLIGVFLGPPIVAFATHWATNLVIGALFLYFAFVLFGAINMQPPRFLMRVVEKAQTTGGVLGIFLMGATLVISSFTCTAPIMGGILALGGSDGDLLRLILGMGVFGLTMAIPFVFLSLVPGRIQAIPKSGEWMNTLKFFLGFVEVAAAFKFISTADIDINEGAKWLPRSLFLVLWGVIFLLAALFLFGLVFRHGGSKPGGKRLAVGVATLVFAGYNAYGATGRPLDMIMTAIAPPFSASAREEFTTWQVVEDDYDAALALARSESKLLLVNFTGHT